MNVTSATQHEQIGPSRGLVGAYGFVPNLFALQKQLSRVIEGEQHLIDAILLREDRLSRRLKDSLLLTVATARSSDYCRALHANKRSRDAEEDHPALLAFARKLANYAPCVCKHDIEALRAAGFDDSKILECILIVALGQLLCTLANALGPSLDAGLPVLPSIESSRLPEPVEWFETTGPYLQPSPPPDSNFQPCAFFQEQFGFVPKIFQEQMLRPDVVDAESQSLAQILIPEDLLSRIAKEHIVLVVSAANLNTYFVAVHSQMLATLGVPLEDSDQIVEDHRCAAISPAELALLDEVRKLAIWPGSEAQFDTAGLQAHGFSEPQILEAIAMAAVTNFLNTVQAGLGAVPDFPPRRVFTRKDLYPSVSASRLTSGATFPDDPDATAVARVQGGDTGAFEELVRRHSRRVFSTLAGLLANLDDARDVTQDVFLKAFENIGRFQGRSKFSTWLTSIAINTGTELLRQRRPSESLDQGEEGDEFRPRQIQSWADNPEQVLAASEMKQLVREGVLRLPEKYRIVVLLRDINQVSTEEAAAALELSIPAVKARLLRGRLMLRESLAPHFVRVQKRSPDAQLR